MIFRRIARGIRRAISFGKEVFKTGKKLLGDIAKNPMKLVNKVLDKVKLPSFIGKFANAFLKSPFAALLPGPVAAIAGALANAKTGGDILDIVRGVTGSNAFAGGPPAARNNIFEMVAAQHARIAFPQIFS